MLRIELVNPDTGVLHEVDLYEDTPVNINYSISDIDDLSSSRAPYSQTFRIPATSTNLDFWGGVIDVTGTPTHPLKRKVDARLYVGTTLLMEGFVQLKAVYRSHRQIHDIEFAFFGEQNSFIRSIGDKKLNALDMSAYAHDLTWTNIQDSWSGSLFSGDVRYALIDKGRNYSNANSMNEDNPIRLIDFTMMVRAKVLLEKIFSEAGYTLSAGGFQDEALFDELYILVYKGDTPIEGSLLSTLGFRSEILSNQAVSFSSSGAVLELDDTGLFDFGGNWDNTAHDYTSPAHNLYTFELGLILQVQEAFSNLGGSAKIRVLKNGSEQVFITPAFSGGTNYTNHEWTGYFEVELGINDTLQVVTLQDGVDVIINVGSYLVMQEATSVSASPVDFINNLPDIKQIEFVKGLQTMFNLVFTTEDREGEVMMQTFNDYMDAGGVEDWTEKVDMDKDFVMYPTTDDQSRRYEFRYQEGEDLVNSLIQNSENRTFGRYLIEDPENDFASGENIVETIFAPFPLSYVPQKSIAIHRMIDDSGEPIGDAKPRIAFWNGTRTHQGIYVDTSTSVVEVTSLPHFSMYEDGGQDVTELSLCYGVDVAFSEITTPYRTLYHEYWNRRYVELYSEEARKVKCHVFLEPIDVINFSHNTKYFIENEYYRVVEINQYPANQRAICEVTLVKVFIAPPPCEYTPIDNDYAVVTFVGPGGAPSGGNQRCCEYYGFFWSGTKCERRSRPRIIKPVSPIRDGDTLTDEEIEWVGAAKNLLLPDTGELILKGNNYTSQKPAISIYAATNAGFQSSYKTTLSTHQTAKTNIDIYLPARAYAGAVPSPLVMDSTGQISNTENRQVNVSLIVHTAGKNTSITDGYIFMNRWSGANGTARLYLPRVAASAGRLIRIKSDSSISANTKVELRPDANDTSATIDGSSLFEFDRAYDGIMVMEYDGDWYIIQRKSK